MLLFKKVDDIKVIDICVGYVCTAILTGVVSKASYAIGKRRAEMKIEAEKANGKTKEHKKSEKES